MSNMGKNYPPEIVFTVSWFRKKKNYYWKYRKSGYVEQVTLKAIFLYIILLIIFNY